MPTNMKITYLTNYYTPEVTAGANRASEQVKVLKEYGHEVRVITGYPNYPQGKLLGDYDIRKTTREYVDGIEVIRCSHRISKNRSMVMRICQYLSFMYATFIFLMTDRQIKSEDGNDLLYVSSGPIFVALVGWLISRIRNVKMIIEYRDITHIQLEAVKNSKTPAVKVIKAIELLIARSSYKTVVSTESFRRYLIEEGLPLSDVITVYNGVLESEGSASTEENETVREVLSVIESEKLIFMYIGTIGISQDLCALMDDIATCTVPKQLIVIGDGAQKKLVETYSKTAGYPIHMFPSVPKNATKALYQASDIQVVKLKDHPLFGMFLPSKVFDIMKAGKMIYYFGPEGEVTELMDKYGIGLYGDFINEQHNFSSDRINHIGSNNEALVYDLFNRRNQLKNLLQ